ncbi:unnamed protein product [Rhizoctonia solani]|uniref:C2H2-type domain-containing protein n=1 Tax=Rhizoctonia solani TaxID=456999 RepID=A0A8H3B2H3_9AGAM|nr:unnamed protein product [Rhizoctonia solani]
MSIECYTIRSSQQTMLGADWDSHEQGIMDEICNPTTSRRSNSCPARVVPNINKRANSGILGRFLLAKPLIRLQGYLRWMLAFVNFLWIVYHLAHFTAKCVYRAIAACVEHLEPHMSCIMPAERDSGREKGIPTEDLHSLGIGTIPHWASMANRGAGMSDQVSRGRPKGHHTSYMPHEGTIPDIGNASWPLSCGAYDPHCLEELYDPSLIDTLLFSEEHFMPGPSSEFLDLALVGHNLPHNQFQEAYSYLRLHSEGPHGDYPGGFESMEPPNPHRPNRAAGSSIKTFPPHVRSPDDCRDDRHYGQSIPSIVPVSHTKPCMVSANVLHTSETYSTGSARRTRRPNTCDICGKEVRRPGVLEDHINSHTGQRRE